MNQLFVLLVLHIIIEISFHLCDFLTIFIQFLVLLIQFISIIHELLC